jgi:putative endonuclease
MGQAGEDQAAAYLESLGYRIAGRNVRYPIGEIDILAFDGDVLVIVEVKAGRTGKYGLAIERVGPQKQRKLRQLADRLSQDHPMKTLRIDVVNVDEDGAITHIANAVQGDW